MSTDDYETALALVGDVVLCPACLAELVRFTTATFKAAQYLPAARPRGVEGSGEGQLWCRCGAGACHPCAEGRAVEMGHLGLRLLVRSGEWIGWRALGGE